MSIFALIHRATPVSTPTPPDAPLTGQPPSRPPAERDAANIAAGLAAYVPTEAIVLYTSALAFLVPDDMSAASQDYAPRWILAVAVAVLAAFYAVGISRREHRGTSPRVPVPWAKVVVVLIAFAAWVCVIPGSPFNSLGWYTPARGAVVGMFIQAALGVSALFREP